jgi:hypothetical protein
MNNTGAHAALAGYLYQMLGEWGFLAEAYEKPTITVNGISALLAFTAGAQAFHESINQDLGLVGVDPSGVKKRIFVQYKYSTVAAPLEGSELVEIAESFLESKNEANSIEFLPPEYVLKTNRPLAQSAVDCQDAATNGHHHSLLGKPTEKKALREVLKTMSRTKVRQAGVDGYKAFLVKRRQLIVARLNEFLGSASLPG